MTDETQDFIKPEKTKPEKLTPLEHADRAMTHAQRNAGAFAYKLELAISQAEDDPIPMHFDRLRQALADYQQAVKDVSDMERVYTRRKVEQSCAH